MVRVLGTKSIGLSQTILGCVGTENLRDRRLHVVKQGKSSLERDTVLLASPWWHFVR